MRTPRLEVMTLNGINVHYLRGTAARVRALWRAADEEDILQADQMARMFPDEPERHTATRLGTALRYLGAVTEYGPLVED